MHANHFTQSPKGYRQSRWAELEVALLAKRLCELSLMLPTHHWHPCLAVDSQLAMSRLWCYLPRHNLPSWWLHPSNLHHAYPALTRPASAR